MNGVLEATIDVLARSGYAALSFEDVAKAAGVSRTTVYRRWPSKHDLARAALLRLAELRSVARDTGTLRGDLLELIQHKFAGDRRAREREAGLVRALMAEFDDPELVALVRLVRERVRQPIVAAIERAIARGELPAGTSPLLVIEPIFATLHFRVALFGEEPDLALGEQLVDLVLAGARTGAAVQR